MKYVLYGSGDYGRRALALAGEENVAFFLDSDPKKWGLKIKGKEVFGLQNIKLQNDKKIVITVSPEKEEDVAKKLESNGIRDYIYYTTFAQNCLRKKILSRTNYIEQYRKSIQWIKNHTINGEGIICHTDFPKSYPEVTGYYIPTLLRWGYRELAISYAQWLCSIQKSDGSWYNTEDTAPYIFDTAQVLKGLLAIRNCIPSVDSHIQAGCEWIISCMQKDGRLITPTKEAWGEDVNVCDEIIHIYCISPLIDAANIFGRIEYKDKALQIWQYYKVHYSDKIMNFSLLSHFYAYLMEALLDIGEFEMAREAMRKMEKFQKKNGAVPAFNNCDWVCSTGLFQLALVWFRLGNIERGNKAFLYAMKLQNESGGWYGSYLSEENADEYNSYLPTSEISWAVKFFLDALYYKNVAEFEDSYNDFLPFIDKDDERYQLILKELQNIKNTSENKVLDVGCGKGRYLKNLAEDLRKNKYYAVDISERVMKCFGTNVAEKRQGTLTQIPFEDAYFDFTYACESMEHAIDIDSALAEIVRVTKPGGKVVIIDKNINLLGRMEITPWEQWFNIDEIRNTLKKHCNSVRVCTELSYGGKKADGLFCAWIGEV